MQSLALMQTTYGSYMHPCDMKSRDIMHGFAHTVSSFERFFLHNSVCLALFLKEWCKKYVDFMLKVRRLSLGCLLI